MPRRDDIDDGTLLKAVIFQRAQTGKCSQQDLADRLGMSKAGVRYRLHILEAEGVLTLERSDIRPVTHPLEGFVEGRLVFYLQSVPGKPFNITVVEPARD